MSLWIATLERIFGGVDFIDGPSFLRAAVGVTVIAFLLHVLFRWPDFHRVRWRFAYSIYWTFLLSSLFFPMPVSHASLAIFKLLPQPVQFLPLPGLLQNPSRVLLSWLQQNILWLLAFIPPGVMSVFCYPKLRLRYLHGPAVSAALLLATLLLNLLTTVSYLPIRADRALAWALGFLIGQILVALTRKLLAHRASRRALAPQTPVHPQSIPIEPKN